MNSKHKITVVIPDGYTVIQRTWPETPAGGKVIVWWEKGHEPDTHFKCEGESPGGFFCEGIAPTLDEALSDLLDWFDSMDQTVEQTFRADDDENE
jgi:hypothetical protein